MAKYVLNPDYKDKTLEEIREVILEYLRKLPTLKTVEHNKKIDVVEVNKSTVLLDRHEGGTTDITFDELNECINLLINGVKINTSILKEKVSQRHNQTPMMAILYDSDLLIKINKIK
jgi:hypothetical protein